jgi:hypothetical protein
MVDLKSEIQNYGVSGRSLLDLTETPSSRLLDYLDLLPKENVPADESGVLPDGVAESQGRPLLFIVNESRLLQAQGDPTKQLKVLRRKLASRGDRAYLAVIRPGELSVVPVSLDEATPEWTRYEPGTPEADTFFTRLANGHYAGAGEPSEADYVFSSMFKLVLSVADRLAAMNLKRTDVLSLMGRALFFRFLKDRNVVRETDRRRIAPSAASILDSFANAENAAHTSAWLDRTFNGDLLPLTDDGSENYFAAIGQRTGGRVFVHLSAILRGEEPAGDAAWQTLLPFPPEERNWGAYDFAHVPVGLLSQVYESFAWKWDHRNAKETSVHYTPRNIAATLVDEVFIKLPNAPGARVLDPACGASVFLVLAFRRLYQERWKATGERPDTKAIREILDTQLTGFDISESAIKLAALSLYLTAIELDPKPVPPEKLKFGHLRNKVLFNLRRDGDDPAEGPVAGSLGPHVGSNFDAKFDLVLGNPPWTSLIGNERSLAAELNRLSKSIISRRADQHIADSYENPDFGPDLPFVWKSTEWCKPGGRIAMALPARILLKQEDLPRRARETFLRLVEVTGIINGANLSDTPVWPNMNQPFILLFARNRLPKPGHRLRLITPHYDRSLNRNGETRIDSKSAHAIEIEATFAKPWIWKALAVGTQLDADVIDRIDQANISPLGVYWKSLQLFDGQGYQTAEKQKQSDASFLKGLPNLTGIEPGEFLLDIGGLPAFNRAELLRPRRPEIYRAPLTLMKQAPGPNRADAWALLSFHDVAYNRSFHGYSAAGHPEAEALSRYLHLYAHSNIRIHYVLCTKARFGAERRVLDKADFDDCPIVSFDKLSKDERETAARLSDRLVAGDSTVFEEIDVFFGRLFGLDTKDLEVVADTVAVAMPYMESRERACLPPRPAEREHFRKRLESILRPFFRVTDDDPQVDLWRPDSAFLQTSAPFGLLFISKRGATVSAAAETLFRDTLLRLADETGSTRIIQQVDGGLLVALLNQYRYWTPSRARLLGAELVRAYLDVFET